MITRLKFTVLFAIVILALPASAQDDPAVIANYLFSFGGQGSQPGAIDRAGGLAVDADGNIYVAETINERIQVFSPFGDSLEIIEADADGTRIGVVNYLDIGTDGTFYLGTNNPPRVRVYDPDWTLIREIDGQFAIVLGLAVADDGTLYVSDSRNHLTKVFNADGEMIDSFAVSTGENHVPAAIDIGADGLLYMAAIANGGTNWGGYQIFEPDGTLVRQFESQKGDAEFWPIPQGVTVGADGNIYSFETLAYNPSFLTIYDNDGTLLRKFNPIQEQTGAPDMAISPDGTRLYVPSLYHVNVIALTEDMPFTARDVKENGRVRSGPGSTFGVLGTVAAGDQVLVTGANEAGDWLQIRFDGQEGWIAEFLTEPVE